MRYSLVSVRRVNSNKVEITGVGEDAGKGNLWMPLVRITDSLWRIFKTVKI